jgi:hypothetical protein
MGNEGLTELRIKLRGTFLKGSILCFVLRVQTMCTLAIAR